VLPLAARPLVPGLVLGRRRQAGARLTIAIESTLVSTDACSVTNHRDYNASLTPTHVTLQMEDLLPSTKYELPSAMGTVSDGPRNVACRCEWPLPSCQACSWA
jgi:hypothetical protein